MVVIGDNGASKEGAMSGVIARSSIAAIANPISEAELLKLNLTQIDQIGTPEGINANYPLGWAQATNTPFKYWKQDAHSEGGTHNPLIVFYPKGIKEKGGIRNQYGHVIDLLPTTLEFVCIKAPEAIRGIKQDSIQGTSLLYSFDNAKAISLHTVQYYYFLVQDQFTKTVGKQGLLIKHQLPEVLLGPQ